MNNNAPLKQRLLNLGLQIPRILLPRKSVDLSAWAVIACDQFTQDRRYWERVRETVGDRASTLNLIFPEVYLESGGGQNPSGGEARRERIAAIHRNMASYLGGGIFAPPFTGGVYVERDSPHHRRRRGLVAAVDLDRYDWGARTRSLIRATEDTVPARLPPRMEIRRGAPLESPHILLLIDDDQDSLFSALAGLLDSAEPAYRGKLMLDSGAVAGWRLDREEHWTLIAEKLESLRCRAERRYAEAAPAEGEGGEGAPFLYAMGDGNHSLAAAKGIWEEYKAAHPGEPGLADHPLRFALVEIENLYDPAVSFQPIHRILFNADAGALLAALDSLPDFKAAPLEGEGALDRLRRLVGDREAPGTRLGLVSGPRLFLLETSAPGLAPVALQPLLDRFAAADGGISIDYIHGEEELIRLAGPREGGTGRPGGETGATGILLPPIRAAGLFETVARSGPLPRKSFSMGESVEKRFYLECRSLSRNP
ncbi:MAG: DUF1015 domain-containing protein [Treponema sp.]|nr:DUF1015 domain-containing protein [Treponema sp.]